METHFAEYACPRDRDRFLRTHALLRLTPALVAVAALAGAPAAWAHGGTRSTGYVSTFSNLQPLVLGVTVNVFGSNNTMNLSNYSGKNIVVLGRAGEPYLRFTPGGVQENMRSPTTYLNHSQPVPAASGSAVMPKWRKVSNGTGYAWHDHRIVWTGSSPPPVVTTAPDTSHLIFRWAIPATADGKRFLIKGFLGWAPPPEKPGESSRWWIVAAAAGASAIVATALALGSRARRARRRAL